MCLATLFFVEYLLELTRERSEAGRGRAGLRDSAAMLGAHPSAGWAAALGRRLTGLDSGPGGRAPWGLLAGGVDPAGLAVAPAGVLPSRERGSLV